MSETTRDSAPLELLLVNKEGLVGDVKAGGCLGHSNYELMKF